MPFFRRSSDEERQASQVAAGEQAASLSALEQGGLPFGAQQRLAEHAQSGTFSSDLSVGEFALLRGIGMRPVAQVMGSSIYHVGWQQRPGAGGFQVAGLSQELRVLSEAWNTARLRAFDRLEQEAKLAGADAVVGVELTVGRHDFAVGAIEYVAVGTAVRTDDGEPVDRPVVTDLSGQDFWKLRQSGYRPIGVVGASSVHYVAAGWATQQAQSGFGSSWQNQELKDFTGGVYDARETTLGRMTREARALGAAGVVGVSIDHSVEQREAGSGRTDLVVTFHVLGTAIGAADAGSRPLEPAPRLALSSDNNQSHVLGGSR